MTWQDVEHALRLKIEDACQQHGGQLPFAEFMKLALYAPGLGYYSAGHIKIGPQGDFVTAPEISSLFSMCLAHQCQSILDQMHCEEPVIVELGAGTGKMATDLLRYLSQQNALPNYYYILEVSADLKERQQHMLRTCMPEYFERIKWISRLDDLSFEGIVLANEVIDAMPAHLFKIENGTVLEGFVASHDGNLTLSFDTPVTPGLQEAVGKLGIEFSEGYTSEILMTLEPWLASLNNSLKRGMMLFIDYGFPRHEYYHPSRQMGTLMCHSQHRAHSDPLHNIGMQDITAHVDFTALALSAKQCQLGIAGFTTQAAFLLGNHLLEFAKAPSYDDIKTASQLSRQVQMLTAPHEMGELFKIMALSKQIDINLPAFNWQDHRRRL